MVAKTRYFYKPSFSLLQQKIALSYAYPNSKTIIDINELMWTGKIKPTPLSKEYNVLVFYSGKKSPETYAIGEGLKDLTRSDFPHKYSVNDKSKIVKLCLFLPGANEWTGKKLIANTIIPWAIEWLYFYEVWLATGEWCGGGEHPGASIP